MTVRIITGDCREMLPTLEAESVDAVVTDPPAGISFMGKDWDCFRRRHNPADVGRDNVFGRTSDRAPHSYGESDRQDFDDGTKRMWWQKPDGTNGLDGYPLERLALYGIDRIGTAQAVAVVEGEKACDALHARNIAAVGTQTGASGTPSAATWAPLIGRHLVLWPDNDDAGDKHAERNAAGLDALGQVKGNVWAFVWWPDDWDEIEEVLR